MLCPKCGMQNNDTDRFCGRCGTMLQSNVQTNNNSFNQQSFNVNTQRDNYLNNQAVINQSFQSTNNSYGNNAIYKLTLNRPKSFVGSLVKFKIYIDNNKVGTIKNGETVVLDVPSGNHNISFNKTMDQNINITSDTYADVMVIAGSKFGISNIRDNNGNVQNNEIYEGNANRITSSAYGPLLLSCACIVITFILLFTVNMVVSPFIYGISMGYAIISLTSIKKNKQILNDKYSSLVRLNIISIIISIIGVAISVYLMLG